MGPRYHRFTTGSPHEQRFGNGVSALFMAEVRGEPASTSLNVWGGEILDAVQSAGIFRDSKDFVDSPLLVPPEECWKRWRAMPRPVTTEAIRAFVSSTFGPPGHDLVQWVPTDHTDSPAMLRRLPAGLLRDFASGLNGLWASLGRRLSNATLAHPELTTLLPARHPFIVPGGRFREAYYWDSYWICLGLLTVDMRDTAASLTANLIDVARSHGFVPNGLRTYYLNRSQPPMLTQMVAALVHHSARPAYAAGGARATAAEAARAIERNGLGAQTHSLLQDALPVLDAEYEWWMRPNCSAVRLPADGTRPASLLNRYEVRTNEPRPESWREDVTTASPAPPSDRADIYAELAAGAASGWDFSSR